MEAIRHQEPGPMMGLRMGVPLALEQIVQRTLAKQVADRYQTAADLVSDVRRVPILKDRPATWADARQLTFDEAYIEFVDVSPDGKRLLVSSDRAGNMDLWVMEVEKR